MRRTLEVGLGIFSMVLVLSALMYLIICLTVTHGYYSYREVDICISDHGNIYAVFTDGDIIWEKELEEQPVRVFRYFDYSKLFQVIGYDTGTISVYRLEDKVFEDYKLLIEDTYLYKIGDNYYIREIFLRFY